MNEVQKEKRTISEKLDSVIGVFSPRIAGRRKIYRAAGKRVLSVYSGASKDRLRKSWMPGGGSADKDLLTELPILRERSRALNRNNGYASGITTTMTTNVVGTGIKPQSRLDRERLGINKEIAEIFQRKVERIWERWVPFADSTERMNFYEIQQLVDRQILENGEAIILPLMLKDKNRPYNLALDVVEGDRLDTPYDKRSNRYIRAGVKIGDRGQPLVYYIRKTHPGDVALTLGEPNARKFMEIPAKNNQGRPNVLHLYWVLRPGQTRGVPFFAPVMALFKDLADYLEAEVVAQRVTACLAIFFETADPYGAATGNANTTNSDGQRVQDMEPGMVKYMAPGEKMTSFEPKRPGGAFDPFMEQVLRAIGSALGLPYELVLKNFSKTNYSSARAALLEARKYFRCRQEWLSGRLCQPIWRMVLEEAYLRGELPITTFYEEYLEWTRVRWISPGWQWVDPLKEIKASKEAIQANLATLADECASQGKDWEELMEQRAREENKRKNLDLQAIGEKPGDDEEIDEIIKRGDDEEKEAEQRQALQSIGV